MVEIQTQYYKPRVCVCTEVKMAFQLFDRLGCVSSSSELIITFSTIFATTFYPPEKIEMRVVHVLFILTAVWMSLSVHVEGQCNQPPVVIDSLPAFECSVLSNDFNIQSLTQAFFPANRRQALAVEVYYYVNRTVHPLDPNRFTSTDNSTSMEADYVYLWFSSAVLAFIEPRLLSGLSLNTLTVQRSFAHIVIAPLVREDDEDWVRGTLTNATIWVSVGMLPGVHT